HFLMSQSVKPTDHVGTGPQPEHSVYRQDFLLDILDLAEQMLQYLAIDLYLAPGDRGIDQDTHQCGVFEGIEFLFPKPHGLAASQLTVAQIMQRLCDNGLVERVGT